MINLSKAQKNIVDLDQGSFLVLASAGSGKTRVLTERIKRLSEKSQGKILALTFTNKASSELKERLGDSGKSKKIFIGTFHSFCQSILELRFKLLGYSRMPQIFEDDLDRIEIIKQAILSVPYFKDVYNEKSNKDKSQYIFNALQFISTIKRELIPPKALVKRSVDEEYKFLFETYQDILKSNNAIDFDDIIRLVYDLLINNDAVANLYRRAYSYICIDECQDLNKLQYFFLKALCGDTINNVMMVGDPNQSIFGFNGATASFMLNDFVEDFEARRILLEENFRCSNAVIEASNKLMNLNIAASNYVIKGIFEIHGLASEADEAAFVINKIKKLIKTRIYSDIEGYIDYSKIAILGRNKFVFRDVIERLAAEDIPFYFKSGTLGLRLNSAAMKIFDLLFRLKINPLDNLHKMRLKDILQIEDINNAEEFERSQFPYALKIKKIVDEISFENLHLKIEDLKALFNNCILVDEDKKLSLDELEDFRLQLIQFKKQSLKPTLGGFKSSIALGITKMSGKNDVGVTLSTVHTMKGQESEIVFLIGMDDGTFPDYRAISKGETGIKEERNNAYVAFTRAKRFLFVSYPKVRLMPWGASKHKAPSRFLGPFLNDELQ